MIIDGPDKNRHEFPVPAFWNMQTRVNIGVCIRTGRPSRNRAHAHNHTGDKYFGWTCFFGGVQPATVDGLPGDTMLHEWAHHLNPDKGHTLKWAQDFVNLGGNPVRAGECCSAFKKWADAQWRKAQEPAQPVFRKVAADRQPYPAGTVLTATYQGCTYSADALGDGRVHFNGITYRSLSEAARVGVTGYQTNGWRFWQPS